MNPSRIVRMGLVVGFIGVMLVGCSSDKKTSDSVVVTDSASTEAPSTEAASTEAESSESSGASTADSVAGDGTSTEAASTEAAATEVAPADGTEASVSEAAAGGSLAADSKTCVALGRVKALNDKSGELSNTFIGKITSSGSSEEIGKQFENFVGEFKTESQTLLPELNSAYDDLAAEQPQFKNDLENLKSVTVKLIDVMGDLKADDLERFEQILTTAVDQDKMIEAGQASLKIDKFSKESCGIPFANT
jgi:hypothetical protein